MYLTNAFSKKLSVVSSYYRSHIDSTKLRDSHNWRNIDK